MNIQVSFL